MSLKLKLTQQMLDLVLYSILFDCSKISLLSIHFGGIL